MPTPNGNYSLTKLFTLKCNHGNLEIHHVNLSTNILCLSLTICTIITIITIIITIIITTIIIITITITITIIITSWPSSLSSRPSTDGVGQAR